MDDIACSNELLCRTKLAIVMNYELDLAFLEELTNDKLEKYVLSCLRLNEDFIPDLSKFCSEICGWKKPATVVGEC